MGGVAKTGFDLILGMFDTGAAKGAAQLGTDAGASALPRKGSKLGIDAVDESDALLGAAAKKQGAGVPLPAPQLVAAARRQLEAQADQALREAEAVWMRLNSKNPADIPVISEAFAKAGRLYQQAGLRERAIFSFTRAGDGKAVAAMVKDGKYAEATAQVLQALDKGFMLEGSAVFKAAHEVANAGRAALGRAPYSREEFLSVFSNYLKQPTASIDLAVSPRPWVAAPRVVHHDGIDVSATVVFEESQKAFFRAATMLRGKGAGAIQEAYAEAGDLALKAHQFERAVICFSRAGKEQEMFAAMARGNITHETALTGVMRELTSLQPEVMSPASDAAVAIVDAGRAARRLPRMDLDTLSRLLTQGAQNPSVMPHVLAQIFP